jgi:hypothetical protein
VEAQAVTSKTVKIQLMIPDPMDRERRKVMDVIVPKAKGQSASAIKLIQLFFPC